MLILKIGGGENINLEGVVADLCRLHEPFVIVLGANACRDRLLGQLGLEKQVVTSVSGYDSVLSDQSQIDVIMMAYAGLRNKRLVELCQRHGIDAIGLSGLDGGLIRGERNKGIRVRENGKTLIKRDFSGKPRSVNTPLLRLFLEQGLRPVISIPICDESGHAINSENDDIVVCLQQALGATTVIQLIEAPGFLLDPSDEASLATRLTSTDVTRHEQDTSGRMKRKLKALLKLINNGAARIIIADGRGDSPVHDALNGGGTLIE